MNHTFEKNCALANLCTIISAHGTAQIREDLYYHFETSSVIQERQFSVSE